MTDNLAKELIILISGRAGTGKTTTANFLASELNKKGYTTVKNSFATGVKDIASEGGWDGNKDERGRVLLQNIGKVFRDYDIDTWIKYSLAYIQDAPIPIDIVIYDDWRFPNEFDYFKRDQTYQIKTIRVYAPDREILKGQPCYNDISEIALPTELDDDYYDVIVDNTGTIDYLKSCVEAIANFLIDTSEKWK